MPFARVDHHPICCHGPACVEEALSKSCFEHRYNSYRILYLEEGIRNRLDSYLDQGQVWSGFKYSASSHPYVVWD